MSTYATLGPNISVLAFAGSIRFQHLSARMAGVDFNALRARTMGSGNDEEAVTVNTRALIDKVLARYSGEWWV